jgi:dihydrofolate synthase/folylpolyglutamate synthase
MHIEEARQIIRDAEQRGSRLGLQSITELLRKLGSPERCLKIVHVAGTNGKGSTCMMIAAVLKAAGYRVGVYVSPAVNGFNERIQVDGEPIADREIARIMVPMKAAIESMTKVLPTEFELVTAMALYYFAEQACDIVVLEVGLGGLADATNAIPTPLISVFTPIAMDHTQILGASLEAIASVKAGIIKPGGMTVTCQQDAAVMHVLECAADTEDNRLFIAAPGTVTAVRTAPEGIAVRYRDAELMLGLVAPYQVDNANLAVAVLEQLEAHYGYHVPLEAYVRGLSEVRWPARMERIAKGPTTLIDGAHNPHGVKALAKSLETLYPDRRIIGVMGVLADKAVDEMLTAILPVLDEIIVTEPPNERAMPAVILREHIEQVFKRRVAASYESVLDAVSAVRAAYADEDAVVVYFGSLYFLGVVRSRYLSQ